MDVDKLQTGQHVEVDLAGLVADEVTLGPGLFGVGEVTEIRTDHSAVVRLDTPIAGKTEIIAPAARIIGLSAAPQAVTS